MLLSIFQDYVPAHLQFEASASHFLWVINTDVEIPTASLSLKFAHAEEVAPQCTARCCILANRSSPPSCKEDYLNFSSCLLRNSSLARLENASTSKGRYC